MPHRNIVVVGGSTGAMEALRTLLSGLPADFPGAMFVALHSSPQSPGVLDRILQRASRLPVEYATDREPIRPGRVLLAPANRHLLLKPRDVRTTTGPRENRFRPAVDPLFRTAAVAHGPRVIGILLSGGLDDGAAGLGLIKQHGGRAIVQDPGEALAPSMPLAAIRHVAVDHVISIGAMAELLGRVVQEPVEEKVPSMDRPEVRDIAEGGAEAIHHADALGPPSPFTCPDCGGTLWEFRNGDLVQFQCHVGHRYSADALATAQTESLDHALWTALRALEETAELRRRMANRAHDRGMAALAASYATQAEESESRARLIRRVIMPGERPADEDLVEPYPPDPVGGRHQG
jgi:two-component system, chemotaxis family, protein-glutamate methylesterase/glutaminase